MAEWTTARMPSQAGKVAIVTGATSGIGFYTALALAGAGAMVVLAGRSEAKGRRACARIRARHPAAHVGFETMDLASLDSIAAFANRFAARRPSLDLLINNAGVMAVPEWRATADGFEMQFGTNYLGHFALTARLLPSLLRSRAARIVSVGSLAHRRGAIRFDDLQGEREYRPWRAYGQSKLAILIFALELQRRSETNGWPLISVAAHPGWAATDIHSSGPRMGRTGLAERLLAAVNPLVAQSAAEGALPILFAATSPDAEGGGYYGPNGWGELRGAPAPAEVAPQALDHAVAERLWAVSEALTGVSMDDPG